MANKTGTPLSELVVAALTDLHHPTKIETATWAAENLADENLLQRDADCEFWREGWQRAADYGILGAWVDPEYGGKGHDVVTALLMHEGLGYGCADAGLAFSLGTQVWTMQPLVERFGSAAQKDQYLRPLVDGSAIGAFCITEAESGSDTFAMTTSFETEGDDFILSGTKSYITMGPVADVIIVFATSDPALGSWGVTTFIVDAKTAGITAGPNRPKMGMRTTPFSNITFDKVRLTADNVLGKVGAGAAVFSAAMEAERAFMLAAQIGLMERQLDQAVAYSQERTQSGQPIGEFQAVSHRLANMKLRHDNARLQLYRSAALFAMGRRRWKRRR